MTDVNKADKSARDYLTQSGARPICIVETEGVCEFLLKADPTALVTFWTHQEGSALLKAARQIAGKSCPDLATATEALQRAAVQCRVSLTPHEAAMASAAIGARNLDAYLESWRKSGHLAVFNGRYKRERAAATASGRGFMLYSAALGRLRRLLIPILATGVQQGVGTLFEQIFPPAK